MKAKAKDINEQKRINGPLRGNEELKFGRKSRVNQDLR